MNNLTPQAREIGELMCAMTEQVLWPDASDRIKARRFDNTLMCRVGSGQATYHRFDPNKRQHQITYGAKMIEAKHRPDTASGWLSTREIVKRGYFEGELSTLNLLSHTCCHEFAHLLQHNAGRRYRGSVHNRHFYQILDDLYADGQANRCRQTLSELAEHEGILLSEERFELPDPSQSRAIWQVGDAVAFATSSRELEGEVLRVNRKTCTVLGTGHNRGVRYRVPIQLLRHIKAR